MKIFEHLSEHNTGFQDFPFLIVRDQIAFVEISRGSE